MFGGQLCLNYDGKARPCRCVTCHLDLLPDEVIPYDGYDLGLMFVRGLVSTPKVS